MLPQEAFLQKDLHQDVHRGPEAALLQDDLHHRTIAAYLQAFHRIIEQLYPKPRFVLERVRIPAQAPSNPLTHRKVNQFEAMHRRLTHSTHVVAPFS